MDFSTQPVPNSLFISYISLTVSSECKYVVSYVGSCESLSMRMAEQRCYGLNKGSGSKGCVRRREALHPEHPCTYFFLHISAEDY